MATIAKLLPYELWEIDAVEGWLDDMASQGLIFTHNSGGQFYFREGEPQKLRHRLDLHKPSIDPDRRREEFLDFGWEHICYIDARTDIYRAVREDAVELNTDEEILRDMLEGSQRKLRRTMYICWGISAALLLFAIISLCRFGFFHIPLKKDFLDLFKLLLWSVLIILGDSRLWRSYRELQQRSLLDRTYHAKTQETVRRKEQRLRTIVCLVLLVITAIPLFKGDYTVGEHTEIADTGHEEYSLQEFLPTEATDDEGYAMFYAHTLSKEYYFPQKTASGTQYYVNAYETKGAWLARCYAREQARLANAESIIVPGHEAAWFYLGTPVTQRHYTNKPDTQNLLLLQDNLIVEIEYTGSADLRSAAETMG